MPDICVALCTCPDIDTARKIARHLVDEQLAACVNIIPGVESVYRWQGEVHTDPEVQLVIKTTQSAVESANQRVQELHPYDLPEWLVLTDASGSEAYVNWIRSSLDEV